MYTLFTATPNSGSIPLTVEFSGYPYSNLTGYWNLGNNTFATGVYATGIYTQNGFYYPKITYTPTVSSTYLRYNLLPQSPLNTQAPSGINSGFFNFFKIMYGGTTQLSGIRNNQWENSGYFLPYRTVDANPTNSWDEIPLNLNFSGDFSIEAQYIVNPFLSGSHGFFGIQTYTSNGNCELEFNPEVTGILVCNKNKSTVLSTGIFSPWPSSLWFNTARIPTGIYFLKNIDLYDGKNSVSYSPMPSGLGGVQSNNDDSICNKWHVRGLYLAKTQAAQFGYCSSAGGSSLTTTYATVPNSILALGTKQYNKLRITFSSDRYTKYLRSIKVIEAGVGVVDTGGTFGDANLNSWKNLGQASAIIDTNPYQPSNPKVIVIPSGSGAVILERNFPAYDIDTMGPPFTLFLQYEVFYPGSGYIHDDFSWFENNDVKLTLFPDLTSVRSGIGVESVYKPLNWIANSNSAKDFGIYPVDCYRNDVSGNLIYRYRVAPSGMYKLHTSGTSSSYKIGATGFFGVHASFSGGYAHPIKTIRCEAEDRLPNSGFNPYGSMYTWFNEDFVSNSNTYLGSGVFIDSSGSLYGVSDSGLVTGRSYTPINTGDFILDIKMLSSGTRYHGPKIYSSSDYVSLQWTGISGYNPKPIYEVSDIIYDGIYNNEFPPKPVPYPTLPTGSIPTTWWSRIKRYTLPDGGVEISMWWASGSTYPSSTGWILASSGESTAYKIYETGAFPLNNLKFESSSGNAYYQDIRLYTNSIPLQYTSSGILAYNVPWEFSGEIFGYGSIANVLNEYRVMSGFAFGEGAILSDITYTPAPIVPVISVMPLKSIYPVLTNNRITPYRTESEDKIQSKIEVYYKNRLINIKDINIEWWLNYSGGTWGLAETAVTNRYGIQNLYHPCTNVNGAVDCCLGYAKVTVDGLEYYSNIVRYNFVHKKEYNLDLNIDGGTCAEQLLGLDRSAFDEFSAGTFTSYRVDYITIDRMHA